MYTVEIKNSALKSLEKAPAEMKKRLWKIIRSLEINPRPLGAKKLKDAPKLWRIRVSDFRIIYQILENNRLVIVAAVGPRKDIYRRFRGRI